MQVEMIKTVLNEDHEPSEGDGNYLVEHAIRGWIVAAWIYETWFERSSGQMFSPCFTISAYKLPPLSFG
ncbi:hypothetical protein LCGC14_2711840 [marine sediment metagenome]|uniref:Uncharacterized protein n=1 Tax=marine sediment metagenome TaxID=412755 RepID=A0A0F9A0G4_9ZZZZ